MSIELDSHMQKEEQILFPLMRRGGHPMIAQPIAVMLAEHDDHGVRLRELEALTNDFTAPDDACPTWRALYVGVRKLADDLMEHIYIGTSCCFPGSSEPLPRCNEQGRTLAVAGAGMQDTAPLARR
jgi:regulator of cell morphogenesis and NO signaling